MKKIFPLIIILLLTSCTVNQKQKIIKKEVNQKEDKVEKTLKNMTLEEKISQMLILYYENDIVDETLEKTIKQNTPGGFILMKSNITTYEKTKKFVDNIKKISKIVPIIAIDEEGGSVQKLNTLSDIKPSNIPYMYNLGQTNDEELAYNVGKVIAEELRTIGVNVDFAPTIDVYSNPNNEVIGKRSFGSDPNLVAKMGISLAKGLEDNKVIPTYKHFPGHGDTDVDSHQNLPIVNKSYEDLDNLDLIPFKKAVEENGKIIMISHIAVPNITGDNSPASLSKKVIDILKKDLKYDGLIITDALNMGAVTNNYTNEEIYTKAVEAGNDILLMPNSSKEAIEIIKNNISEDRINESVRKILKFKFKYLDENTTLDSSFLASEEHQDILNRIP